MYNLPIEKNVVLIRKYTDAQKRLVSYPQCKVFQFNGEYVAFRDIVGWKSKLFRDNSYNLDHVVAEWLKLHGVKKIYYYEHKTRNLFKLSLLSLSNALKRGEAYKEKLHNHTQIFVPRFLWGVNPPEKNEVLVASRKWIKAEVDCSWLAETFNRLEKREPNIYINPEVRQRLKEIWREKYAQENPITKTNS